MKKYVYCVLIVILVLGSLASCGQNVEPQDESKGAEILVQEGESLEQEQIEEDQTSLLTMRYVPEFSCEDFEGNTITNDYFKDYKLTLINLWGTWCGPCVEELPELQKTFEALQEKGVAFIGVCEDGKGNEELVKEILKKKGVTYVNLLPSTKFYDDFVSICYSFPTSIIVDSDGNVVKEGFSGAQTSEGLTKTIEDLLKDMENNTDSDM